MTGPDYDRLLDDLSQARAETAGTVDERWRENAEQVTQLENRLLVQQSELLKLATKLHFKAPPMRPGPADVGTGRDVAAACRSGDREADAADAAAQRALSAALRPAFLPDQRRQLRHTVIYLLCAAGTVVVDWLLVAAQGMQRASWVFVAAPLLAFAIGYLVIGSVGRPRIPPESKRARKAQLPTRDPKLGLMLCLVASVATAAALLLA